MLQVIIANLIEIDDEGNNLSDRAAAPSSASDIRVVSNLSEVFDRLRIITIFPAFTG
jgi:hypothetical protein